MPLTCTRCASSGFLNLDQIVDEVDVDNMEPETILSWLELHNDNDVTVCDCCGNTEEWYGIPGEHYNTEDPEGNDGPYSYNGGLCECN